MPCDPQLQFFDDTELLATLAEAEKIVTSNSSCEVVWAADMNWDPERDNHFTRTVAAAVARMGLTSVWETRTIDYTHVHTDGISTSTLDHFLVSRRLLEMVEDCQPVHRGDNLSRHSAILLSLRLGDLPKKEASVKPPPRRMPAWYRATREELENYKSTLEEKLRAIKCPPSMLHCKDTMCGDQGHSKTRDKMVLDLLLATVETSYTSLPLTGRAGGREGRREVGAAMLPTEPGLLRARQGRVKSLRQSFITMPSSLMPFGE